MISIKCSSCSASYNLKDELAGKKAKCPNCANIIEIPNSISSEIIQENPIISEKLQNNVVEGQIPQENNKSDDFQKSGIYSHSIYGVKQKKFAIDEKYYIKDKDNKDIMFSVRRIQFLKSFGSIILFLLGILMVFFGLILLLTSDKILGIVIFIFGFGFMYLGFKVYPKRHIEFYESENSDELPEFQIYQDKKIEFLTLNYTLKDKFGTVLAKFKKNLLTDILRKTWHIEFNGKHIMVKEDSVILGILRRFMPYGQFIRTNFIFIDVTNDIKSSKVIGFFKRKFELFDNYVLDLSNDVSYSIPRQTAICMAVLLDTGERR